MFILRTKDKLTYLQLAWQGAVAIFTTRRGGLSTGSYASLNLGLHVGDEKEAVLANRKKLAELISRPLTQFTASSQVHGKRIAIVGQDNMGSGAFELEKAIADCDGMLTDQSAVLFALFADCVPIWLYDPVKRAGGVIHAGWRGTTSGIVPGAIETMERHFGSNPDDLFAAIGPCIGQCCYSVGEDVYQAAQNLAAERRVSLEPFFVSSGSQRWQADLAGFNRALLLAGGIAEARITTSGFCTSCHSSLFFSHRRDRGKTGRMAAIFCLQDDDR
jgi:YfiH family protein